MTRQIGAVILGMVLLSGCVTIEPDQKGWPREEFLYYTIIDKWNDLQLAKRGSDLYVEKRGGTESRQVTSNPYVEGCMFSRDAKYIVYLTAGPEAVRFASETIEVEASHFYIQPVGGGEHTRQEITFQEYEKLILERLGTFLGEGK